MSFFEQGQRVYHRNNQMATGEVLEVVKVGEYSHAYVVKMDNGRPNETFDEFDALALPTVGKGATIHSGSDRYPATIVKVTGSQVHARQDIAEPAEGHDYYNGQKYTYRPDPEAPVKVFRKNKHGRYQASGGYPKLSIGIRSRYEDPSF